MRVDKYLEGKTVDCCYHRTIILAIPITETVSRKLTINT